MVRKAPGEKRSFITTIGETKIFMKLEFFLLALIEIFVFVVPGRGFRSSGETLEDVCTKYLINFEIYLPFINGILCVCLAV